MRLFLFVARHERERLLNDELGEVGQFDVRGGRTLVRRVGVPLVLAIFEQVAEFELERLLHLVQQVADRRDLVERIPEFIEGTTELPERNGVGRNRVVGDCFLRRSGETGGRHHDRLRPGLLDLDHEIRRDRIAVRMEELVGEGVRLADRVEVVVRRVGVAAIGINGEHTIGARDARSPFRNLDERGSILDQQLGKARHGGVVIEHIAGRGSDVASHLDIEMCGLEAEIDRDSTSDVHRGAVRHFQPVVSRWQVRYRHFDIAAEDTHEIEQARLIPVHHNGFVALCIDADELEVDGVEQGSEAAHIDRDSQVGFRVRFKREAGLAFRIANDNAKGAQEPIVVDRIILGRGGDLIDHLDPGCPRVVAGSDGHGRRLARVSLVPDQSLTLAVDLDMEGCRRGLAGLRIEQRVFELIDLADALTICVRRVGIAAVRIDGERAMLALDGRSPLGDRHTIDALHDRARVDVVSLAFCIHVSDDIAAHRLGIVAPDLGVVEVGAGHLQAAENGKTHALIGEECSIGAGVQLLLDAEGSAAQQADFEDRAAFSRAVDRGPGLGGLIPLLDDHLVLAEHVCRNQCVEGEGEILRMPLFDLEVQRVRTKNGRLQIQLG
jgi:hypothetical protein